MVLVDTCSWISLYRGRHPDLEGQLRRLITGNQAAVCGQIHVEFIGGFRDQKKRTEFAKGFSIFPYLETDRPAFRLAADLMAEYAGLNSGDAIIAATAIRNGVPLLTLDKDFLPLRESSLRLLEIL